MFARQFLASAIAAAVATVWPTSGSESSAASRGIARDEACANEESERAFDDMTARLEPRKVHLPQSQVTVTIARAAADCLDRPMWSETLRVVEGKSLAFRVEPHYHAPESGKHPVGWHKGVTVYSVEE